MPNSEAIDTVYNRSHSAAGGTNGNGEPAAVGALSPMDISQPYNTVHRLHAGFDAQTGEFYGLPQPWMELLLQQIR